MNKTIDVNIAGFVFHIEEVAYTQLQSYLEAIEKNFHDESERREIMKDIESRIAELFQSRNSSSKEVIDQNDVDYIVETMGAPSDYVTEDDFAENNTNESYSKKEEHSKYTTSKDQEETSERRMFRDKDNAVVGGVCSGLGAYLGMDPTIIRVIFVVLVLVGFSGIILYIILLFIIPEAVTANDKLKMHGKPITIDNIKATAEDIKNNLKYEASSKKFRKHLNKRIKKSKKVSSDAVKAISKIIGFAFLVGGIFALLILVSIFIGEGGLVPFWGERQNLSLSEGMDILYNSSLQSNLAFISILMILFIPIVGLISSGIKILFQIKSSFKYMALSATVIWVVSIGVLALTSIQMGLEFKEDATISDTIEIPNDLNSLKIEVADDAIFSNKIHYTRYWNNSDLMDVKDDYIYMGYPKLVIVESDKDSTFKVEIQKTSRGFNQREAIFNAEAIEYEVILNNGVLNLAPYLSILKEEKFRAQNLEILVRVPEGKEVVLGNNIERILVPISAHNAQSKDRGVFSNTTWKNDKNKMVFVD